MALTVKEKTTSVWHFFFNSSKCSIMWSRKCCHSSLLSKLPEWGFYSGWCQCGRFQHVTDPAQVSSHWEKDSVSTLAGLCCLKRREYFPPVAYSAPCGSCENMKCFSSYVWHKMHPACWPNQLSPLQNRPLCQLNTKSESDNRRKRKHENTVFWLPVKKLGRLFNKIWNVNLLRECLVWANVPTPNRNTNMLMLSRYNVHHFSVAR